jgi:hypothetical protein
MRLSNRVQRICAYQHDLYAAAVLVLALATAVRLDRVLNVRAQIGRVD